MQLNHVPKVSKSNPTGCCPRFDPRGWDGQIFTFRGKRFVRFTNRNFFHIPLDLSKQIVRVMQAVAAAKADSPDEHLMLSYDISPWQTEHFLAVTKEVSGLENMKLTGKFLAKVFEGPYQNTPKWLEQLQAFVKARKYSLKKIYFNYTTCPACARKYGVNFVVGMAQIA